MHLNMATYLVWPYTECLVEWVELLYAQLMEVISSCLHYL